MLGNSAQGAGNLISPEQSTHNAAWMSGNYHVTTGSLSRVALTMMRDTV